ncbi:phosphatidylinositol-specific phospholipase C/glycerophosphodiester phosphodiesterase family protein [Terrabacter sp. AAH1]
MRLGRFLITLTPTLLVTAVLATTSSPSTATALEATGNPHRATAQPLERAHAHNDYEHARPLADALDHGFTSVEADVWLVDGELYLGHDGPDLTRTLRSHYLDPLAKRFRANGGSIYPGWNGKLRLLIDVKSDGSATWPVIERQLSAYPELVTAFRQGRVQHRAVTAVVSGNRDLPAMQAATTRRSFYDGRLSDLGKGISPTLMPLVSNNWSAVGYTGGPFTEAHRALLRAYVTRAHAQGYEIRFWATPDTPGATRDTVWAEELAADVDAYNTDDLAGLRSWLLTHDPQEG